MIFELFRLRDFRKKYYLKQFDVCRYVGVSDIAYRTWEQHVRKPNDEHLERLKYVFEVLHSFSSEIKDRESAINVLERELCDE